MARFCGKIGFINTVENIPGVFTDSEPNERTYYGDIVRNTRNIESSSNIIDDLNITNSISIIADKYANENFQYMKYVIFNGIKWKINNISIEYPRMTLSIGGMYNG